jgi:hypothetical protein
MKVTSKKKARSSTRRRRVLDKGRSPLKIAGKRSVEKRREATGKVTSGKARPAEGQRNAKRRTAARMRTPVVAKNADAGFVSAGTVAAYEPEGRGAPPALPTPIATFNI